MQQLVVVWEVGDVEPNCVRVGWLSAMMLIRLNRLAGLVLDVIGGTKEFRSQRCVIGACGCECDS